MSNYWDVTESSGVFSNNDSIEAQTSYRLEAIMKLNRFFQKQEEEDEEEEEANGQHMDGHSVLE